MNDRSYPIALIRFFMPGSGVRVGIQVAGSVHDLTPNVESVAAWLRASCGRVDEAISDLRTAAAGVPAFPSETLDNPPNGDLPHWLPPVDVQDVWAAGVTYARSRAARQEEAIDGGDVYARVYVAARPELFFKARAPWVVGPRDAVGIRRDATWNVPESELVLLINPVGEVVGWTIGNDMSSRDIEGENPLYLPQAKIYERACALGPRVVLGPLHSQWPSVPINLRIERAGATVFAGETVSSSIRRTPAELVGYLTRALPAHEGIALFTGTGIVPPEPFTLAAGDLIAIRIDGAGELVNHVVQVGRDG